MCTPKLKEISQYKLLVINGFDKEANNIEKSAKSKSKVSHSVSQNDLLKCKYCNKIYKHKQSKWKHEKKCKEKEKKDENEILKRLLKERMKF